VTIAPRGFLILDACVLIDYWVADKQILRIVAREVGRIAVARPVIEEARDVEARAAKRLGLQIVDPDLLTARRAGSGSRRLSFPDRVTFELAKRKEWTCVTNDRALRHVCIAEKVRVAWGLDMMVQAVKMGTLDAKRALRAAVRMHEENAFVTHALVSAFARSVGLRWPG